MSRALGPKENFRVVVYVPKGYFFPEFADAQKNWESRMQSDAEEIRSAIKRHVDDANDTVIAFDQEPVCEFCGSHWTEDSKDYNGGCCDKDEASQVPAQVSP